MKTAGVLILILAIIIFIVIIYIFTNDEKAEPIFLILIFPSLLFFSSILLSKGSYEQGVKDTINGKVKYEIIRCNKIIIKDK